ncbi:hypothetical protein AX774_g244 [Zancudomyces culisetae]|uniref:Uncharacterized protein n=1 Tax=Zancudomyces culisetae TaxID=1213189 RepID=A0A1R1PYY7_ZANCU|nr:hypothetical protein AX774_g244 [Zancudomyces culisetae]|eukprot:OMH86172.1 hypothetical protein AX774_g244 [Zancudomyces culisetae]
MYSFTGSTKNTPRISLGGKKEKLGSAGIKDVYKNAIRERERRENERQRNKAASVIQAQYRRAVERRAFYVLQEKGLESEILEYESTKENGSNYKLQYHYLEVLLKSSVVFRGIRTKQDNMLLRRVLKMIEEREFGNIEAVNADSDFNPSKNSENEYIGNKIYKIHLLAGVLKVFLRKMTKGDAGFDNYQILDSQERAETLLNILKVIIRLGSQECQFYSDLNATEGYLWSLGQLLEQYYLNKDEICVNVLGLVSYLIIKAFEDADGTENDPEQSKNTIKYIVGGIVTKVGGSSTNTCP